MKKLFTAIRVFFTNLLNWPDNQIEDGVLDKTRALGGPFHTISDFETGDTVSVKDGVCPGGRRSQPVEEVGPMILHGEIQPGIRIRGLPYHPWEVIILKKLDKNKFPIHGLWQ